MRSRSQLHAAPQRRARAGRPRRPRRPRRHDERGPALGVVRRRLRRGHRLQPVIHADAHAPPQGQAHVLLVPLPVVLRPQDFLPRRQVQQEQHGPARQVVLQLPVSPPFPVSPFPFHYPLHTHTHTHTYTHWAVQIRHRYSSAICWPMGQRALPPRRHFRFPYANFLPRNRHTGPS